MRDTREKFFCFLERNGWVLFGGFLLLFSIFINRFPGGYIIIGGDVVQSIDMARQFADMHYGQWWLGRVSLFYGLFYLLDSIGISNTAQLSWYLGIFLLGSYVSFLTFSRLVFPRTSSLFVSLVSFFYAANIYTLYVFTATWGFTHYQILYVFIPVLTGLYLKALLFEGHRYVWWFLVVTTIASMSFGNPAFALSLGIYFLVLTLFVFLSRLISPDRNSAWKIFLMTTGALLINMYWILPLLPQVRGGVEGVASSTDISLSEALRKTSNSIADTIRLMQTHEQEKYYPQNFPYPSISWAKKAIDILAFIPFLWVLWYLFRSGGGNDKNKKIFFVFFGMFVVFVALVARVRFPFEGINAFLFQLPGLNVLRGYDKLAIFSPFLLSVLLLVSLTTWEGKRHLRIVAGISFITVFLLALPFFVGGIQTRLSFMLSHQKAKDFHVAKYSALVKVPDAYFSVAPLLKHDTDDAKMAMLPYSPGSSVGKVDLPGWKVNGPHIARTLYGREFVELTEARIGNWLFAEDFSRYQYDPRWITDLYGLMGVKYVFYQKDAKPNSLEAFESSRTYLESSGALQKVAENNFFALYTLEKDRVFPYVYTSRSSLFLGADPEEISSTLSNFRENISAMTYRRENPLKVTLPIEEETSVDDLRIFLNEKYDPLWTAEYISPKGSRSTLRRDTLVNFANAWKIDGSLSQGGEIDIFYAPLRLMYVGEALSTGVLVGVLVWGWVLLKKTKKG